MPQIAQLAATYSSQIFWLLLTFGFVFFVIGLGMVPKIQSTVDARDSKIAEDLARAKAAFARADELEEEHRTRENEARAAAQGVVAEAKAKAVKDTEKQVATADKKIAGKIAEAEEAVRAASAAALTEIEGVAAEAAQDMVAKISGGKVTAAAAKKAVKAALNG
ncbi:MAG: ATPase [Sphingobium sp.]|jgi:F-type H+-transporting ATPase subunit b|nr:ATPase [Sphingobium sp.]MCP5398510.1 ATPase [Sphingomonas sp.]